MISATELKHQLDQYMGTDQYYYNPLYPSMKYTDGVLALAELAEANWLLDLIGIEYFPQQCNRVIDYNFVVLSLIVKEGQASLKVTDGNFNPYEHRAIGPTDFPEGTWDLWLIRGVLILPSEY